MVVELGLVKAQTRYFEKQSAVPRVSFWVKVSPELLDRFLELFSVKNWPSSRIGCLILSLGIADVHVGDIILFKVRDCARLTLFEKKLLNDARRSINRDHLLNILFIVQAFLSDLKLVVRIYSIAPPRIASYETAFQTATGVLYDIRHHKMNVAELEAVSVLDRLSEFIFRAGFFFL